MTVPGFRTLLQPTSTKSPSMAPNFFSPVGTCSSPFFTTTSVLSDLTLEVTLPADVYKRQAANRMSRHVFRNAVTAEDVVDLYKQNRETKA